MKLLTLLLCLLVGCTHISKSDQEYIARKARNISDVHDRIGNPERVFWSGRTEEHVYLDKGWHTYPLAWIFGVNLLTMPIWMGDWAFFQHERGLSVRFDQETGDIISVEQIRDVRFYGREDIAQH